MRPSRDGWLSPPRRNHVMHAFRVGQVVALAQTSRDLETYEVVQLMPETPSGEPQYRIKGLSSGIVRAVREAEIKPHPDGPTPARPSSASASFGRLRRSRDRALLALRLPESQRTDFGDGPSRERGAF